MPIVQTARRLVAVAALLLAAIPAEAQAHSASLPNTPLGTVAAAWIAAVNGGTDSSFHAYARWYVEDPTDALEVQASEDRLKSVYERSGGFDVARVLESRELGLTVEVTTRNGHSTWDIAFAFSKRSDGTPFIVGVEFRKPAS